MPKRPELVAFALAGLVVLAAVAVVALGEVIPSWFPVLALAAVTGGAGLSVPGAPTGAATEATDYITSVVDDVAGKVDRILRRSVVAPPVRQSAPVPDPGVAPATSGGPVPDPGAGAADTNAAPPPGSVL